MFGNVNANSLNTQTKHSTLVLQKSMLLKLRQFANAMDTVNFAVGGTNDFTVGEIVAGGYI